MTLTRKMSFIHVNAPTRSVAGLLRRVIITLVSVYVASIALCIPTNTTDLLPKTSFCVWPDSIWMRVAQARMIVVASAKRMLATEAPRYHLNVKEVLKGDVNVNELLLLLDDPYNDQIVAQMLDGASDTPVILYLSFTSDTGQVGNSAVCHPISSNFGAAELFTLEKAAAIRAEVARQRQQVDDFSSRVKTERLPHWAEATNLTAQLTLSPTAQQEAVTIIRGKISCLFPALIAAMDDNANLSEELLVLPNYSPTRFERFRRYSPKKVIDLVAALVAEATSISFGDLFNGASDETRRHVVNGWHVLLIHWLEASDGDYNLPPLAISYINPVRDSPDAIIIGAILQVGDGSSTNANPVSNSAVKPQESHQPPAIDSNDDYDDFIF